MNWFRVKKVPECIKDRAFMYYTIMNDGTFVPEYEDDGKETMFTSIDKEKVRTLGLIGREVNFTFNTEDGIITDYKGNKYAIYLPTNDLSMKTATRRVILFGDSPYTDIIQYKKFITDEITSGIDGREDLHVYTTEYSIGWKKTIRSINSGTEIHVKTILSIVLGEGIRISCSASSNKEFEGPIIMLRTDGKAIVSKDATGLKSINFEYMIP